MENKVFVFSHGGVFIGATSVIVAPNEDKAKDMLISELKRYALSHNMNPDPTFFLGDSKDGRKSYTVREINISIPSVLIADDGDY